ncbi:MAG: DUF1566 domain-containing protein [Desulfobacterales bacterium]|nr:DUF1566 domain-containing protein [Desulfobacterales bacterium]
MIGESYWADSTSRAVPVDSACSYLSQILEGLSRLHHAKIIHQDIKPFNIMLSDEGIVKIVDFGLSRRRGEKQVFQYGSRFAGTPFYAAPEQLHAPDTHFPDTIDHRVDLYASGVILYRMLTGHLPAEQDPRPPSSLNPLLDNDCDEFILKSISPDPEDRFQNAESMADALKELSAAYQSSRSKVCATDDIPQRVPEGKVERLVLRSQPARILGKHAKRTFQVDARYQPYTTIQNEFQAGTESVVVDNATGLVWQQGGSRYPMSWSEAKRYVRELFGKGIGGYTGWRLPTMNELLSLLTPHSRESFCLEPVFSTVQKCLWSADTRSKRSAWILDLEMGFVTSGDTADYFHVKCVCSAGDIKKGQAGNPG